eukprot:3019072-Rhodomonas_salina.1
MSGTDIGLTAMTLCFCTEVPGTEAGPTAITRHATSCTDGCHYASAWPCAVLFLAMLLPLPVPTPTTQSYNVRY